MAATMPTPITAVMIQGNTFSLTQYIFAVIAVPRIRNDVLKWKRRSTLIKLLVMLNAGLIFTKNFNKR
jgi:hypothetical protein